MDYSDQSLVNRCRQVLADNTEYDYTVPSKSLYPHQWLWDSCFTSIGLRHIDINQAKRELVSLKRGAWSNGMLPSIIFHHDFLSMDYFLWDSKKYPEAPQSVDTTGITQPPMLAEAVFKTGESMSDKDREEWYESMIDCIVRYHQWLYAERNPEDDGLIVLLHPYESGLDNSLPWISELNRMKYPWWVKAANRDSVKTILNHFRKDIKYVPNSQRIGLANAVKCIYAARQLQKQDYKLAPLGTNQLAVVDLTFNCILMRANERLIEMAEAIGKELPPAFLASVEQTKNSINKLWSKTDKQYFSQSYTTGKLIKKPTIATFMPLYAGCATQDQAKELAKLLKNSKSYGAQFPVPTVDMSSKDFRRGKYWQGPTWLNTNWLIIEGLKRYGFDELAENITRSSISLVSSHGPYEYFSAVDGSPKGVRDFSWSASLTIDLLKTRKN